MRDQWRPDFLRARPGRGEIPESSRRRFYEAPPLGDPPRRPERRRLDDPPRDPARERALARARKIKALAERPGTAEEGKAARAALRRFVKDHKLTMREVDS